MWRATPAGRIGFSVGRSVVSLRPGGSKSNIRLWSFDRETVVWNWEQNPDELRIAEPTGGPFGAPVERLEPNRWYSLVYRATRQGTSIFVNGEAVYRGAKINSQFPSSVVGVNGAAGSTVDVRKFVVRPLE